MKVLSPDQTKPIEREALGTGFTAEAAKLPVDCAYSARKKPHVAKREAPTYRPCAGCGTLLADDPENFCSYCVGNA